MQAVEIYNNHSSLKRLLLWLARTKYRLQQIGTVGHFLAVRGLHGSHHSLRCKILLSFKCFDWLITDINRTADWLMHHLSLLLALLSGQQMLDAVFFSTQRKHRIATNNNNILRQQHSTGFEKHRRALQLQVNSF